MTSRSPSLAAMPLGEGSAGTVAQPPLSDGRGCTSSFQEGHVQRHNCSASAECSEQQSNELHPSSSVVLSQPASSVSSSFPVPLGACAEHPRTTMMQNRYGIYLECQCCGQRWRWMRECCHMWLPVGVRIYLQAHPPPAAPFKARHLEKCPYATSISPACSSGSSSSTTACTCRPPPLIQDCIVVGAADSPSEKH